MIGSTGFPGCETCSHATTCWPCRATTTGSMRSEAIHKVIRAYDDRIVRAYCWGRFGILRQRFLDEIGQYLPARGRVLDVGCGFGLFSLYYATTRPGLTLEGPAPHARPAAKGGGGAPWKGTTATRAGARWRGGRRRGSVSPMFATRSTTPGISGAGTSSTLPPCATSPITPRPI